MSESYRFLEVRINIDLKKEYWDYQFASDVKARLSDDQEISFWHGSESFNEIGRRSLPDEDLETIAMRELSHMLTGLGHRLAMKVAELPSVPLYGEQ